jgi:hypothetical protein
MRRLAQQDIPGLGTVLLQPPCRLITTKTDYGISYGHLHRGDTLWLLAVDLIVITQKRPA